MEGILICFMLLFSTVLFVDGHPVGYKVYEENCSLILDPAENINPGLKPPVLSVIKKNGHWVVEGTESKDLVDQVIEDISIYDRHHFEFTRFFEN